MNTITTPIFKYDVQLFEDRHQRKRLSSRYWVDNLVHTLDFEDLCHAFLAFCPNVCTVKRNKDFDMLTDFKKTHKLEKWCAENATGYWMNTNFPESHASRLESNLLNQYWAFQEINDAIMFRLTFC